ncbi:UV radiation resistance protein and autophagy-related subunit 14-domain-containing protein [Aspergillus carlsbadensis]|nr:UV radiation resistance protein and autophagy-related subunit 14-domain-containing protein [Aspergillus carlsbadensis]
MEPPNFGHYRTGALTSIQNNHKRTDHLWNSLHTKTAEARIFLCREVASLYGLRQKVRKRDNGLKESYMIGGVNIFDLRDLNGKLSLFSLCADPEELSTSFSYIAHMVVLVSHYLSLRLPAEVTLPHRNYPTPTIYTPSASYHARETASVPSNQSSSSGSTSRDVDWHPPPHRPRPLCIKKKLSDVAKDDLRTYGFFIEGVALLGWNVSWLCRSQGLNLGSDSWEDVCDIGKNLWQLLVAPPGNPSTLIRTLAGRDTQAKNKTPKDSPRTTLHRTKSFPMLGHYSHGTAHSFLGASEGTDFIRNWRLPAPTKVTDRLKSTLMGEIASAEWEIVEEKEWNAARQSGNGSSNVRGSCTDSLVFTNAHSNPHQSTGTSSRLSGIPDALLQDELYRRNVYRDTDGAKPTCGSNKQGAYNTSVHVMALFLILTLSTLACSFPILARRFPSLPIPRRFLFLSRHFGTGVLIATAFVHLLPTAFVSLTDPCLPRFWSETYRAMPGFVAMISVFVVVLVEMFFAMKGAGHVHGSEYDQLMGEGTELPGDDQTRDQDYSRLEARGSTDNINLSPMPEIRAPSSTQGYDLHSRNSTDELNPEGATTNLLKEDEDLDRGDSGGNGIPRANGNHRHTSHSHHHRSQSGMSHIDPKLSMQNPQRQLLQCLLLEAGILFHSIFIGMAVSVATGTSFVVLLVAICFHQTFEGFALGSRIASLIPDLFPPSSVKPWLMSLAYGATTPIGQAIGLVLHNMYDPASATGLLMVGITNAISSGLLLFAGLVELLAEDFLSEASYVTLRGQRRVEACIAVAAGALLMAFVGAFA